MSRRPTSLKTGSVEHKKGGPFGSEINVRGDRGGGSKGAGRDERNHAARGSKDKRNRRDETLAKASVEEDYWQGMVAPDPAFYLKDNG
jgi:hypothetical protein